MDIREIIKRLRRNRNRARDEREYGLEDSIGRLIEDIIEDDLEQEREFRKEISRYIDDKIENEIIMEIKNGTIKEVNEVI